jgi:hypothetical protein
MRQLWSDTPKKIITDGDMSSDVTSQVMHLRIFDNIGLQVGWSGSPVGTFTVEASNNDTDYAELVMDAMTTANSPNPFLISINQFPYRTLRLKYTATSGSGTLNAWGSAKGLE